LQLSPTRGPVPLVAHDHTGTLCASLALAAVAALTACAISGRAGFSLAVAAALGFCVAVTEAQQIDVLSRLQMSMSEPLIVLAAVLGGPLTAALCGLLGMIGYEKSPGQRWLTYTSLSVLKGAAAGALVAATVGVSHDADLTRTALAVLIGTAAVVLVSQIGNGAVALVRHVAPIRAHLEMVVRLGVGTCVFAVPVVIALVYGSARAGVPVLFLAIVPLLAAHSFVRTYREKVRLARELSEGTMHFALGLARALDARDPRTANHSAAVAVYARDIARSLDLAPELVAKIQLAGLLHDIGKIGVPQEVLMKPGALADEEWEIIREHPVVGERITRESPIFAEIADIIRHHHERHDGTGYPDGLVGGDIPVAAAIIGLADAYNAMTSPRPYRDAMPPERAIAELGRCAGTQFAPYLVEKFVQALGARDADYQVGHGDEFSFDGHRDAILAELRRTRALVAPGALDPGALAV
jgi:putative nucleotidyltransferase with HDIG domain